MTDKAPDIPPWKDCDSKKAAGEDLTPLEQFVLDNEPAPTTFLFTKDEDWRVSLQEVLASGVGEVIPEPDLQRFVARQEAWMAEASKYTGLKEGIKPGFANGYRQALGDLKFWLDNERKVTKGE